MKHNNLSPSTLRKTFVMQHDQTDCGVACLLSLIRYYGGDCTLEKLRELSGTNTEGTSLLGLYQAAGQTGFTAEGVRSRCGCADRTWTAGDSAHHPRKTSEPLHSLLWLRRQPLRCRRSGTRNRSLHIRRAGTHLAKPCLPDVDT